MLAIIVILVALTFQAYSDDCRGHFGLALDKGNDITEKLGCGSSHSIASECKTETAQECKYNCQNSDRRIATCTGWEWNEIKRRDGRNWPGNRIIGSCILVDGRLGYYSYDSESHAYNDDYYYDSDDNYYFTSNIWSGPVYCDDEKESNVRRAPVSAGWQLVKTCRNTRRSGTLNCDYTKVVGLSKTSTSQTGSSSTESVGVSAEFSTTFGVTGGDPLKFVQAKLEATAKFGINSGFSWTKSSSSTSAFTQRAETRTGVSFDIKAGEIGSVCQPVGSIGDFTIHVDYICLADGNNCDGC